MSTRVNRQVRLRLFATALALLWVGCTSRNTSNVRDYGGPQENAVARAHSMYWDHMAALDAQSAYALLSTDSHVWLDRLAQAVRDAKREQILRLPATEMETVLLARHDICAHDFSTATGPALFELAINNGFLLPLVYDDHFPDVSELATITVTGDVALASPSDRPQYFMWHYLREDGTWKIDLYHSFQDMDRRTAQAAAFKGLPLSEKVVRSVEDLLNERLPDSTWDGMQECTR